MKILIFGAGVLGCNLARNFFRAGKDVTLLAQASADFMPPQEHDMIRFMELLAVSETSRRSMLPKRFSEMPVSEIQTSLAQAKLRALSR